MAPSHTKLEVSISEKSESDSDLFEPYKLKLRDAIIDYALSIYVIALDN